MDYKELLTRSLELEKELTALKVQINNCRILELENKYIGKWFKEKENDCVYYTRITSLNCYNIPKGCGFRIDPSNIEQFTNSEIDIDVAIEVPVEEVYKIVDNFIKKLFENN